MTPQYIVFRNKKAQDIVLKMDYMDCVDYTERVLQVT